MFCEVDVVNFFFFNFFYDIDMFKFSLYYILYNLNFLAKSQKKF